MGNSQLEMRLEELATESAANPFDCVIVGAGSAGLTAALTLAEHQLRVAVLEAGPARFLTHIFNTELRFNRQLSDNVRNQTRYRPQLPTGEPFGQNFSCLGGRGLFWNGSSPRYRAHDFEGWPFTLEDLAPFYAWAEDEFRVETALGQSPLAESMITDLVAAGFPAEPGPFAADAHSMFPGILSAGVASGLGIFLRACGSNITAGTLRVATQVRADRVLIAANEARGVTATDRTTGSQMDVFGRSVVLAAGGIESIRIAGLSEVTDDSGRIGVGLQDHIFYRSFHEGPERYDPAVPASAAVYIPASSQTTQQWEIHAPGRRFFTIDDGTPWSPAPGEAYWMMIRSFAPTTKRDENRVEVREGDLGSAVVHFTHTDDDRARMDAMRAESKQIAGALGLSIENETVDAPGASYHEAGGLDMGTDPATSVTQPDGGFHRVPNLVCADAAAFPRIGAVNPHLTIVAVSRRQAGLLADRLAEQ
jgi:choline dehydrogenase-like flavoprotein